MPVTWSLYHWSQNDQANFITSKTAGRSSRQARARRYRSSWLAQDETARFPRGHRSYLDCFEPPSLTCSVTFEKNPVSRDESTTVHWTSAGAAVFYLNSIGYVGASGSATVSPSYTTDFSGYVSNSADGEGEASYRPATAAREPSRYRMSSGTHLVNGVCVDNDTGSVHAPSATYTRTVPASSPPAPSGT